jgi:hypothetical protein
VRQAAAFGAALRRERERRGVSLEQIAEDTKVGLALLEALERGDLTRWPTGIFRRAFVRAYAEGAGLDSRAVLSEFLRIFPDDDLVAGASTQPSDRLGSVEPPPSELRITLADDGGPKWRGPLSRLAAVVLDVLLVGVLALGARLAGTPWPFPTLLGVGGLAYFAIGIIATGTSPAWWWLQRPRTAGGDAWSETTRTPGGPGGTPSERA